MKRIRHAWLLPALLALAWGSTKLAPALAAEAPADSRPIRAVVHVNFGEAERQGKGLKNIANILKEVGERPSSKWSPTGRASTCWWPPRPKHAEQIAELAAAVCVSWPARTRSPRSRSPRATCSRAWARSPRCAVEVIRKQHEGYAYFRP